MSIIIRLQNLPWAANSLDIRRYFQGLNIPEGGVHIVGGEKGDAFIAFGSDEDARQAMERDGGKIKEVRIKLLLSSRAEMQRIIDQARAQHAAPPPVKKDERRRPSPDDRSRRAPRDRSPRDRSPRRRSRRDHSRSPQYRSRDKDRSRSTRSDERRRSFDEPARAAEPPKVSNGQPPERKTWDEKSAYVDSNKTPAPIFPIGNMSPASRQPGDVGPAPVNMACPPAPVPNLAAFNLPPVGLMGSLSGLTANMMGGLMGPGGTGDVMSGMPAGVNDGVPVPGNLSSALAAHMGAGGLPVNMPANMGPVGPGGVAGASPMAGGLAASIPGGMAGGHMGGMAGPNVGVMGAANVTGNMAAAGMPGPMGGNVPTAFGDAMPMPNNMEGMAPGIADRRVDGGKMNRKNDGGGPPPGGPRDLPRRADESCCVELRGLTSAPTPRDVKDLFRGLRIFSGCIRVATSETGIKSVVVRFANKWDAREALQGDYKQLGGDAIQLFPFPEDLFEQTELLVANSAAPPPNQSRPRDSDMIVVMKGLPYNTSEQDVLQFFGGLNVLDIFVEHDRSGRATGGAFVEFADKRDFEAAMNMQRRKIGHRYIELGVGSRDVMYAARNGDSVHADGGPVNRRDEEEANPHGMMPDRGPEVGPGPGPMHGPVLGPAGAPPHGPGHSLVPPGHTCVSMLGLPNTVTDRDIADFFSTQGVIPRAIHIMLGANGVPTGHAFAEFATHADCERAFLQDGANLGPHLIALKTIPYSEVAQALGGHPRPDGRPDGRPDVRPDGRPENRFDNRFEGRFDGGRPHERSGGRPEGGRPPMRPEGGRFEGGHHPPRDGPPKRPLLERSSRPPLFPEGGPRRGGPPGVFPEQRGGPLLRAPRHEEPQGPGPDAFGKPGCVVTATNIPYRAGVEDIIHFFQGYELTKENVMRRFNDRGQPTGDARIAFPTPRDAQEALAKFGNRLMQGRAITLGIL